LAIEKLRRTPSAKLEKIFNPMKSLYSHDKSSFYQGCRGIS
jgi:hypothetical protein